jgi:hypothetical protein
MGLYLPSRRALAEIMADPERRKKLFSDAAKAVSTADEPGTRPQKRKRGKNARRKLVYPTGGPRLFRLSANKRKGKGKSPWRE